MDNKQCVYFFRVHVKLQDPDDSVHLCFDFRTGTVAINVAEMLFNSSDLYSIWVEIVTNEVTTTDSPMWRE